MQVSPVIEKRVSLSAGSGRFPSGRAQADACASNAGILIPTDSSGHYHRLTPLGTTQTPADADASTRDFSLKIHNLQL
jgi:hypothetical protein